MRAGYYAQEGKERAKREQASKQACKQASKQAGKQAGKQTSKRLSKQEVGAMPFRGLFTKLKADTDKQIQRK